MTGHFVETRFVLLFAFLAIDPLNGQDTNVLTWHNDSARTGLNSTETTLTHASVNKNQFGKICSTASGAIDGQIFAQPLVLTGSIPGHNHVVYIETMNDSVYFIDGDSPGCEIIRQFSLLPANEEAVQCGDIGAGTCYVFNPLIGILGTPVINPANSTMYLVTWSKSRAPACSLGRGQNPSTCFVHRLHAIDIVTGSEKSNGPVAIPLLKSGPVTFDSKRHIQRPGLLLLPNIGPQGDGLLYLAFSSMDGAGTPGVNMPNGWMFRFAAQDLSAPPVAWSSTPNGEGGGVWMTGAGLAAGPDKAGGQEYIYIATGDGTFDADTKGSDYGDSVVQLTPDLQPGSYFAPYKQYCDDIHDVDLGSGGVMLLPSGSASSTISFAVANGKDGNLYVVDRSSLGGYTGPLSDVCPTAGGPNLNVETVNASSHGFHSTAAYWNGNIYSIADHSPLQKYTVSAACSPGPVCSTPAATSLSEFGYGPAPVVSSNGNIRGTAIVWSLHGGSWPLPDSALLRAQLFAYDAERVGNGNIIPLLWNSEQCPNRDTPGNAGKFTTPTVANGKVFIATIDPEDATNSRGRLDVYGATTAPCN